MNMPPAQRRWPMNRETSARVIGGDGLRAFLYLIRNSFFVPQVEQAF
jgi:hypothetical protein